MPETQIAEMLPAYPTGELDRLLTDPHLSLKSKGLFFSLAALAYPSRFVQVPQREIKAICNIGRDALRSATRELEEREYLSIDRSQMDGLWQTNTYFLLPRN